MRQLKIGLLGLGQVGSGVYSILKSKGPSLARKNGTSFKIEKIAVRNPEKKRLVRAKRSELTTRTKALVQDPNIDVIVELIGGIHPAKELILAALRSGKDVVTANKALLAEHGREIFGEARDIGAGGNILSEKNQPLCTRGFFHNKFVYVLDVFHPVRDRKRLRFRAYEARPLIEV